MTAFRLTRDSERNMRGCHRVCAPCRIVSLVNPRCRHLPAPQSSGHAEPVGVVLRIVQPQNFSRSLFIFLPQPAAKGSANIGSWIGREQDENEIDMLARKTTTASSASAATSERGAEFRIR